MDAGSWRIQDNDIRFPVLFDEAVVKHILHVSGKEFRILYAVVFGVGPGIGDSFFHIFHSYDFPGLAGKEQGDGTGAGVEVIQDFVSL